jgi:hypothetical protein
LESVPTPLGRTHDGPSIHLRIRNGLVSIMPFEELLTELEIRGQDIGRRLKTKEKIFETVGPIDGYRLQFVIARFDDPASIGGPRAGQITRQYVRYAFELIPVSDEIGEEVELAIAPGGSLHRYLTSEKRQTSAVTVWFYPDSYNDFRLLKSKLWNLGLAVAAHPMDFGQPPRGEMQVGEGPREALFQ